MINILQYWQNIIFLQNNFFYNDLLCGSLEGLSNVLLPRSGDLMGDLRLMGLALGVSRSGLPSRLQLRWSSRSRIRSITSGSTASGSSSSSSRSPSPIIQNFNRISFSLQTCLFRLKFRLLNACTCAYILYIYRHKFSIMSLKINLTSKCWNKSPKLFVLRQLCLAKN